MIPRKEEDHIKRGFTRGNIKVAELTLISITEPLTLLYVTTHGKTLQWISPQNRLCIRCRHYADRHLILHTRAWRSASEA